MYVSGGGEILRKGRMKGMKEVAGDRLTNSNDPAPTASIHPDLPAVVVSDHIEFRCRNLICLLYGAS